MYRNTNVIHTEGDLMANSVDPDLTAEQSDLGLHCLHVPLCLHIQGKYSTLAKTITRAVSHTDIKTNTKIVVVGLNAGQSYHWRFQAGPILLLVLMAAK